MLFEACCELRNNASTSSTPLRPRRSLFPGWRPAPCFTSAAGRPQPSAASRQRRRLRCSSAALDTEKRGGSVAVSAAAGAELSAAPAAGGIDISGGGGANSSSATTAALDKEILDISLPTLATLAADTVAGLVSTAFVGRLGFEELAAVGVALSLFSTATKIVNTPMVTVATSIVATAVGEEERAAARGASSSSSSSSGGGIGAAVSSCIVLALFTGALEAAVLGFGGGLGLELWGAGVESPLHASAADYLLLRALAAPATLLLITLQGCFRGLGDTTTPFKMILLSNVLNVVLTPLFIFTFDWGVAGAAGAIGASQVLCCAILLVSLHHRHPLSLAGGEALRSSLRYLKPTGLVMLRTAAINGTFAAATAMVARTDATHTAAHQVAFQVWMAAGLLSDSLAVAAHSMLARREAVGDSVAGKAVAERTLLLGLYLGLALAGALGALSPFLPPLFTEDADVQHAISLVMPLVVATQPFYSLAYVMNAVLYGVGGFRYGATATLLSSGASLAVMLGGSALAERWGTGFDGMLVALWVGVGCVMPLRFAAMYWPYWRGEPPFRSLRLADRRAR